MGGCNFGIILPMNVAKCQRGKVYVFCWKKLSESSGFHYLEPGFQPSKADIIEALHTHSRRTQSEPKTVLPFKSPEECKKLKITLQMKDLVLHFLIQTWDTLSVKMLATYLE